MAIIVRRAAKPKTLSVITKEIATPGKVYKKTRSTCFGTGMDWYGRLARPIIG